MAAWARCYIWVIGPRRCMSSKSPKEKNRNLFPMRREMGIGKCEMGKRQKSASPEYAARTVHTGFSPNSLLGLNFIYQRDFRVHSMNPEMVTGPAMTPSVLPLGLRKVAYRDSTDPNRGYTMASGNGAPIQERSPVLHRNKKGEQLWRGLSLVPGTAHGLSLGRTRQSRLHSKGAGSYCLVMLSAF